MNRVRYINRPEQTEVDIRLYKDRQIDRQSQD